MIGGQFKWRGLWSVTQTGTVTNERANGINGPNPLDITDYYTIGYFHIAVITKTNLPLLGVRVYGAPTGTLFPAAGTLGEALVSTVTDLAAGTGILRAAAMHQADGDVPGRLVLIPPRLILEYDTGAPGATPTITFVVRASFVGIVPFNVEG